MGFQIYVFIKRPQDPLWSYSSFRNMAAVTSHIKYYKKMGFNKIKIIKLPIEGN